MKIMGIDQGFKGLLTLFGASDLGIETSICPSLRFGNIHVWDMPTFSMKKGKSKKLSYNLNLIRCILVHANPDIVFIEKVQILPKGFTIKSNTNLAFSEGMWLMAFECLGIKYELVNPRAWQIHFGISSKKGDTKDQSVMIAHQLFPNVELKTPKGRVLDGLADALLIAEYGRRKLEGKTDEIMNKLME
jgi:hypothetical protein